MMSTSNVYAKVYDCGQCKGRHARPVGRRCTKQIMTDSQTVHKPVECQNDLVQHQTADSMALNAIMEKMNQMHETFQHHVSTINNRLSAIEQTHSSDVPEEDGYSTASEHNDREGMQHEAMPEPLSDSDEESFTVDTGAEMPESELEGDSSDEGEISGVVIARPKAKKLQRQNRQTRHRNINSNQSSHPAHQVYSVNERQSPGAPQQVNTPQDNAAAREVAQHLLEATLRQVLPDTDSKTVRGLSLKGKKSGFVRTHEDNVKVDIDWPHLHVRRVDLDKGLKYSNLAMGEFVFGYLEMLEITSSEFDKPLMLNILSQIMEDAMDFHWQGCRKAYGEFAKEVEDGISQWGDASRLLRLRQKHAHRHPLGEPYKPIITNSFASDAQVPCGSFQYGNCSQSASHGKWGHFCKYCNSKNSTHKFPHSERNCNRKRRENSKNEYQGDQPRDPPSTMRTPWST